MLSKQQGIYFLFNFLKFYLWAAKSAGKLSPDVFQGSESLPGRGKGLLWEQEQSQEVCSEMRASEGGKETEGSEEKTGDHEEKLTATEQNQKVAVGAQWKKKDWGSWKGPDGTQLSGSTWKPWSS